MSLEVDQLCFSYGSTTVLNRISFDCQRAEVFGILGANGAGKSTLLKCMLRILTATSGDVKLDGQDLALMSHRDRARAMSYIPQSLIAAPGLSVFQAVLLGRVPRFRWRPQTEDLSRVEETLRELGIESLSERIVTSLSGGERQKVLIARSLCMDTPVLLFDEMTNSLDLRHQIEILDHLHRRTKEQGLISVLILHDLNLASLYCDRVLLLKAGRCRAVGTPQEVLSEQQLDATYGIRPLVLSHNEELYVLPRKG